MLRDENLPHQVWERPIEADNWKEATPFADTVRLI
jgi:hypothetical protein